jgi:hypothetical protein
VLRIKIIKGPDIGKSFDLTPGDHVVGRAPDCNIILSSSGISKNHARFSVQGTKCILTDLDSSNGTFVNGTKIHDRILRPGDRIGFHDIIVELSLHQGSDRSLQTSHRPGQRLLGGWNESVAYQQPISNGDVHQVNNLHMASQNEVAPTFLGMVENYIDRVILPGVYHLAEMYPLSHVLAGFVVIFILLVTALATIPMAALTHDGVQKEAERRALTIARQLSATSEKYLASGSEGNIRTDLAEGEDGVVTALVVSVDGHIIAPLSKSESYSNNGFVAQARKHENEPYYISELSGSNIGVSVPIRGFSQELGQPVVVAESIIIYKMESQNWSSSVGLFARILIIALIFGGLLYFLLFKLVSHPIIEATSQLDGALRGEKDSIQLKFDFQIFQKFIENINSAISRMSKSQDMVNRSSSIDRNAEASNLVRIISDPALALDDKGLFLQVNGPFEELIGMRLLTLLGQDLSILQDQALTLNLQDLLQKAKSSMGTIVTNSLEMSGVSFEIDMMASADTDQLEQIAYAIATLKKRNEA